MADHIQPRTVEGNLTIVTRVPAKGGKPIVEQTLDKGNEAHHAFLHMFRLGDWVVTLERAAFDSGVAALSVKYLPGGKEPGPVGR
ncbi:MAG TPA: hypothetical protein VGE45_00315 [Chloroflexia bacterium]|jgi:hypothetical protein